MRLQEGYCGIRAGGFDEIASGGQPAGTTTVRGSAARWLTFPAGSELNSGHVLLEWREADVTYGVSLHGDNGTNRRLARSACKTWIDPSGSGNVTKTHVLWSHKNEGGYVPSPVAHNGKMFLVDDKGLASCWDVKSGKEYWREQLSGVEAELASGSRVSARWCYRSTLRLAHSTNT